MNKIYLPVFALIALTGCTERLESKIDNLDGKLTTYQQVTNSNLLVLDSKIENVSAEGHKNYLDIKNDLTNPNSQYRKDLEALAFGGSPTSSQGSARDDRAEFEQLRAEKARQEEDDHVLELIRKEKAAEAAARAEREALEHKVKAEGYREGLIEERNRWSKATGFDAPERVRPPLNDGVFARGPRPCLSGRRVYGRSYDDDDR